MMLNSALSCEVEALRRELKEKDQQIERLVSRDNLTGLLNWPSTKVFLESSLESRNPVGLLYMDFDYFKVFNRTYGFILGGLLLAQFGKAVQEHMDMIRGESYANLFRSKEDTKTGLSRCMDESMELDAYYSMPPLGITRYELTGDMMITYMNQAMFDIIGYTREQFFEETGKNLRQLVYPDDLDIMYQNSLRMIEGENMAPFVYRFIRRDGSISTVLYHQCTVKASDKRPLVQSMYIRLDLPEDAVHE